MNFYNEILHFLKDFWREHALGVFWKSYVRSIYVLSPGGSAHKKVIHILKIL